MSERPEDRQAEQERIERQIIVAWPDGVQRWHTDSLFHAAVRTASEILLRAVDGDDSWLDHDRMARHARQQRELHQVMQAEKANHAHHSRDARWSREARP